jgi:hypothetical protein
MNQALGFASRAQIVQSKAARGAIRAFSRGIGRFGAVSSIQHLEFFANHPQIRQREQRFERKRPAIPP